MITSNIPKEVLKGTFGVGAMNAAVYISKLHLSDVLQILSLVVGLAIGILTAWSILLTIIWKLKNNKRNRKY